MKSFNQKNKAEKLKTTAMILGLVLAEGVISLGSPKLSQAGWFWKKRETTKTPAETRTDRDNAARNGNQPQVRSSVDEVLSDTTFGSRQHQVYITPGLYKVADEDDRRTHSYFIVDSFEDNDAQMYAFMLPRNILDYKAKRENVIGSVYKIKPAEDGTVLSLKPVTVNAEGSVIEPSALDSEAPFLEVKSLEGPTHFPYILSALNGASIPGSDQVHLVIRPITFFENRVSLVNNPSKNIFNGVDKRGHTALVSYSGVELDVGASGIQQFKMFPFNKGTYGNLYGLNYKKANATTGSGRTNAKVERLAIFLRGCFKREHFLLMTPVAGSQGKFVMDVFVERHRNLSDYLMPIRGRM